MHLVVEQPIASSAHQRFNRHPSQPVSSRWWEFIGVAALVGLAVFFVATSWRKWPDPLIDFGAQLYSAWQLSEGAVLYRDVNSLYGPLSQYFNAGLFTLFGPGLIVLAIANLAIFGLILTAAYFLFRRCWGVLPAFVGVAIFISVFGFSHFIATGNFNYATPYAHEATHGMLISLSLGLVLIRWIETGTAVWSSLAGFLFGLTIVLKPEFILAGGVMTAAAVATHWKHYGWPRPRVLCFWAIAALAPTAAFSCYFSCFMSWSQAISAASRAWMSTLDVAVAGDPFEMRLLGFDQPGRRLLDSSAATLFAGVIVSAVAILVRLIERKAQRWWLVSCGVFVTVAFGWLGCYVVTWINSGRCLVGLMSIYALILLARVLGGPPARPQVFARLVPRLLMALLGTTLMARMFLDSRIFHYGFYQAALAGSMVPAILISEPPEWLRSGWRGQSVAIIATFSLIVPGVLILAKQSQYALSLQTTPVSSGRDRFYALPPQMDPIGTIIDRLTDTLRENHGVNSRVEVPDLVVLPEGEFINYLARLPSPLPNADYYAGSTENGREEEVVKELERRPPFWIVLISRDLTGYGIARYGEKVGSGREILRWVYQNYEQIDAIGDDPLDYWQRGALVLKRQVR